MIPVALLLFGFIFAAGSATVSAQGSVVAGNLQPGNPSGGQLGSGAMGQQQVSTSVPVGGQVFAPPGNPFVFVLPTQPVATGPALVPGGPPVVYPQYSPRRLRDG